MILPVIAFGLFYGAIGLIFGALARGAGSPEMRQVWRFAAWFLSAVAFAIHIRYEFRRVQGSAVKTAARAATAVAIGGFGLAVSATVHARSAGIATRPYLIALVAWPALVAIPAFVVALAAAAILKRAR